MKTEKTLLLAGNPNVGKSTLFNALTGMHQHTGNWTGKTVATAVGEYRNGGTVYRLIDIPGTYSLFTHSAEEEVARNAIAFSSYDGVVAVCDASSLLRGLALALQIAEVSPRTLLCINLLDEAKKKGVSVDLIALSRASGLSSVGISARKKKSLSAISTAFSDLLNQKENCAVIPYHAPIEAAITSLSRDFSSAADALGVPTRWLMLRLLDKDASLRKELLSRLGEDLFADARVALCREKTERSLADEGYNGIDDAVTSAIFQRANEIAKKATAKPAVKQKDRLHRVMTGPLAFPFMLLLLLLVIWITVEGANLPSEWLSLGFGRLGQLLSRALTSLALPPDAVSLLIDGVYAVTTTVIAVMLPPMAIFFPLFSLLEEAGFLPRFAYNLDAPFARAGSCGKQALTMCMGFGCNAVGVDGCRIIDSPRERVLAAVTNAFVPCNGRFPAIIAIATVFFVGERGFPYSLFSAVTVFLLILLGIAVSFLVTRILSATLLSGVPSSFILELPPFRRPKILSVIFRSLKERTFTVLCRAVAIAAPAGAILWLLSHVTVGESSLLSSLADGLAPVGEVLSLDGIILLGFLVGIVANEIVIPVILMGYTASGSLMGETDTAALGNILAENGWTVFTAIAFLLFALFHFPCITTLLTVRKETGKTRYALLAACVPTLIGILFCSLLTLLQMMFF